MSDNAGPEAVGIAALSWIAGNEDMLGRFMALTGIEASQIRQAAAEPGFLAGVLDFLLAHEPSLMAFLQRNGNRPGSRAAGPRGIARQSGQRMVVKVTPEERRRIAALGQSDRPLLVGDIDEVVLNPRALQDFSKAWPNCAGSFVRRKSLRNGNGVIFVQSQPFRNTLQPLGPKLGIDVGQFLTPAKKTCTCPHFARGT